MVPIPKPNKGKSKPENSHPISLLSSLSKMPEKIILEKIQHFDTATNVIWNEQFGIRSGHITNMQVARIITDIVTNFNKNNVTTMALLDIEKAFDTVYIDGSLYKLIKNNLPRYLVALLHSYVRGRESFKAQYWDQLFLIISLMIYLHLLKQNSQNMRTTRPYTLTRSEHKLRRSKFRYTWISYWSMPGTGKLKLITLKLNTLYLAKNLKM